ncbi:MAG: hypothetical protein BME94_00645 [Methanobacteriales archaeon Met13]
MGLKIKELYVDQEFYTVEVINYLQERKTPFIIPCVLRGRSEGIQNLFKGRKSYTTRYTMRSQEEKATFTTHIMVKYSKSKNKRKGNRYFAHAAYGVDIPVNKTFKEYQKRFGIESSYKLMNQARARTTTKKPALRLLYIGLGFLLVNIWIYIQWTYLSIRRKGGHQPVPWTFKTMQRQITRKTEEKLGFQEDTPLSH